MRSSLFAAATVAALSTAASAQKEPAVRPLGPITRVSMEPMATVTTAVPLSDGRVFVNDVASRRVLLFDSTLATAKVVADSTSVTARAYGARPGALFAYRGDSALFVDPASASMPVLSPAGAIARVMAMPTLGNRLPLNMTSALSPPGFDARGRLVSFIVVLLPPPDPSPGKASTVAMTLDSSLIVRFDLDARTVDTIASFKTQKLSQVIQRDDEGRFMSATITPDVLPLIDDWTVSSDGSVAIIRGRDYHIDWLGTDGKWRSTAKMPFAWQHLDDSEKTRLIDSAMTAIKARRDTFEAAMAGRGGPGVVLAGGGGRGGGGGDGAVGRGGGGGAPAGPPPAIIDGRPASSDLPDYRPPFLRGSTRADVDGNIWIRTTTLAKGQPVYDIVSRQGTIVDRVQLPPFRTIAGFGPGTIYMAVKDSAGVVHLEKARIK
jgi:hypothetical protein